MKKTICILLILLVQLLVAMQQDNYNWQLPNDQTALFVDDPEGVHVAAKSGNIETIQKLLDNGVSINERNQEYETPLHVASRTGNDDIVQ
ncbi:hypothetical protein FACS189449_01610 [Alphaproteobacteria bacterium]|nr:hypothetical protein FACS189449_01610 [Alphaproteobacteria bacterium]